ncbi:hypothetical protein EFK50_15475 [Nocardioides marmoriginsengisoli]|uniref:Antitoxin FitA-like ribbon-helix-helix domain-containing protein n=1 Tax=Nocardioides marmoriginsengisoli TaxID=661483 RepID=A0A3N0CI60_9ACTN|nr:hypothetical protein [Nocardioides marmoriginsengisoli]RNL63110.1 hypothetical protein EFK50_15475 [Nocardioides marmoriginsengisoli]
MTVALQIRDVPDDIRDLLAEQARTRGQSMQAYLLDVVVREAQLGSKVDLFWPPAEFRIDVAATGLDPVAIVREGRDGGFGIDRAEPDR